MKNPKLQNHEAEAKVIGAILVKPESYHKISGEIDADDFAVDANRIIFNSLAKMTRADVEIDVITVSDYLENDGKADTTGGISYLGKLANEASGASIISAHAKIVRNCAERRRMVEAFADLSAQLKGGADPMAVVAEAGLSLDSVSRRGVSASVDFLTAMSRTGEHLAEAVENKKQGIAGVPTGLRQLDARLGGFMKSRLIAIAARPSIGKTALANQISLYGSSHGTDVGICSLEMSVEELTMRSAANKYGINFSALAHANEKAVKQFEVSLGEDLDLLKTKLHFDTETYSLSGIVARITEWKRKHDIGMAVIDHIGLIEGQGKENKNDWLSEVSRTFKKLSKKLEIPVVIVCQLNRNVEREKRMPQLSDLRDSGGIEQDIDIGLFLHTDDDDDVLVKNMSIGILKNRQGTKGWLSCYKFDGRYQRFTETPQMYREVA